MRSIHACLSIPLLVAFPAHASFPQCIWDPPTVSVAAESPDNVPLNAAIFLHHTAACSPYTATPEAVMVVQATTAAPDAGVTDADAGSFSALTPSYTSRVITQKSSYRATWTVMKPNGLLLPSTTYAGTVDGVSFQFTTGTRVEDARPGIPSLSVDTPDCKPTVAVPWPVPGGAVSDCTWHLTLHAPPGSEGSAGLFHLDGLNSNSSTVTVLKAAGADTSLEFNQSVYDTSRCFTVQFENGDGQLSQLSPETCPPSAAGTPATETPGGTGCSASSSGPITALMVVLAWGRWASRRKSAASQSRPSRV